MYVDCHFIVGSGSSQCGGSAVVGPHERHATLERTAASKDVLRSVGGDSREPIVVDEERGAASTAAAEPQQSWCQSHQRKKQ